MRDILLWRTLADANADPTLLAALLTELAAQPLAKRVAFVGRLPTLLAHAEPSVRAAAVAALAGGTGWRCYREIVRRLDDAEPTVRAAAVRSLAESCRLDPHRWLHALLHPEPTVRAAALSAEVPDEAADWQVLLLADEALRESVRSRIQRVPSVLLPAVFEFVRGGQLPTADARRIIAASPQAVVRDELAETAQGRTAAELGELLRLARAGGSAELAALPGRDPLDDLCAVFWDTTSSADDSPESVFLRESCREVCQSESPDAPVSLAEMLSGSVLPTDPTCQEPSPLFRSRLVAAVLRQGALRGSWNPHLTAACATLFPGLLRLDWIPAEVRRAAFGELYQLGPHLRRYSQAMVVDLLRGPICRRPSGLPDLWLVGALLQRLAGEPYKTAISVFGLSAIVDAFSESPIDSAAFFQLPDDAKGGRRHLLSEIGNRSPTARGTVNALLVFVVPSDRLEFLDALSPRAALELCNTLRTLRSQPGLSLTDNKIARVAESLAPKLAEIPGELLTALTADSAAADELDHRLLGAVAQRVSAHAFVTAALTLRPNQLLVLLELIRNSAGCPLACEMLLAHELAERFGRERGSKSATPERALVEWADARLPKATATAPAARSVGSSGRLLAQVLNAIRTGPEGRLAELIAPALAAPSSGLCSALSARAKPTAPSVAACQALLVCHDPPGEVAAEFALYGSSDFGFVTELDRQMAERWAYADGLPLLGRAWLWRWERQSLPLGDELLARPGGVAESLRWGRTLTATVLAERLWQAVADLLGVWRHRSPDKLSAALAGDLVPTLADAVVGPLGPSAAKALVTLHHGRVAPAELARVAPDVTQKLPAIEPSVRVTLSDWISIGGIEGPAVRLRPTVPTPGSPPIARIRELLDLDELEELCRGSSVGKVVEATFRLIELAPLGLERLVRLLSPSERATPPRAYHAGLIAETVVLWPTGPSLTAIRRLARDAAADPEVRFLVALALCSAGERDMAAHVFDAARRPTEPSWFDPEHWKRLIRDVGRSELDCAAELAVSPHPFAYRAAVKALLAVEMSPQSAAALTAFLETDSRRPTALRVEAAHALRTHGELCGLPVLLTDALSEKPTAAADAAADRVLGVLAGLDAELTEQLVEGALAVGPQVVSEARLVELILHRSLHPETRERALTCVLREAALGKTRSTVLQKLRPTEARGHKLRRLAEVFAGGVRTGRDITGRLHRIEMTAEGLGHTRLTSNKIWVNPLPMLRGDINGEAVVRGLIAHEFGHHLCHAGPDNAKVWQRAEEANLHGLLNLVSDEHLERNLRAREAAYGDDLKKLAAYAFQHAEKDVEVPALLRCLQSRALPVLSAARLGVARKRGCVRVRQGSLLLEMEQAGLAFARFVRSLRMGLGNRQNDPLLSEALALFDRGFRKSDMERLWQITQELRRLFGWQVALVEHCGQESIFVGDRDELDAHAEGIGAEELQREVERVLEPPRRSTRTDRRLGPSRAVINVGPDASFTTIADVEAVRYDPAEAAALAREVARPAAQMRRFLEVMGLRMRPERLRTTGRIVDRSRLGAAVIRSDPRILIVRRPEVRTDLFLGLIIDCSGSMGSGQSIEKAKLFAALLAEAGRGLAGLDVRVIGFTDCKLFDAGDTRRCAAHALEAGGGNNDAAGLFHMAELARRSRRAARLLVMISDGLPTECSVTALRELVKRLTKSRVACAQVAVRPLEEVCFPHFVELKENDLPASVRAFGSVIVRLVRRTLRG